MRHVAVDQLASTRERALAEGIKDIAAELRLIDPVHLVVYIQLEKHGNLDDLVASSIELYFKPGILRYGWRSSVDLTWGGTLSIDLDMEFQHQGVTMFFCLSLGALHASVDIHSITFSGASSGPAENTARLLAAIADARLRPTA